MMNNIRIFAALLRKEITLMRRNPIIPRVILLMPVMVMLVIPLVATFDVRDVAVAVADPRPGQESRRVIADVDASPWLRVASVSSSHSEAMARLERGEADVILSLPEDFAATLGMPSVEANGVNATRGALGSQYTVQAAARSIAGLRGVAYPEAVSTVYLYNPTLDFRNFMIPALMVVLLIIICGFLPTLNLVSEKEQGTLEAINVTPVGRMTFVLSKLVPFWVVGIFVVTIGMVVGLAVYGLRPAGSIGGIYLAAVLFSLLMSGIGVIIANKSASMLQSIFVMFALIIIFQLMGGLFTPISSMPEWAQTVTYAVPPRYFNEIMRAIYLKGATIGDLVPQYLCLTGLAAAACITAAATYEKRS